MYDSMRVELDARLSTQHDERPTKNKGLLSCGIVRGNETSRQ